MKTQILNKKTGASIFQLTPAISGARAGRELVGICL